MATVTISYVGPYDEIEIVSTRQTCKRSDSVEVDAAVAGKAPSGDPDSKKYDPGEGLLAQAENWQAGKAKPKDTTKDGE